MSAARRRFVLGLAALATLGASVWALEDDGDDSAPRSTVRSTAASARPTPTAADVPWLLLELPQRGAPKVTHRNLFAAIANPPAPTAPLPMAPAASAVPVIALPFSFGGRFVSGAGASVLLNEGAATHVLAIGGTLGDFRFEQDSGSQLEFIHVPSGARLSLPLPP